LFAIQPRCQSFCPAFPVANAIVHSGCRKRTVPLRYLLSSGTHPGRPDRLFCGWFCHFVGSLPIGFSPNLDAIFFSLLFWSEAFFSCHLRFFPSHLYFYNKLVCWFREMNKLSPTFLDQQTPPTSVHLSLYDTPHPSYGRLTPGPGILHCPAADTAWSMCSLPSSLTSTVDGRSLTTFFYWPSSLCRPSSRS